MYARIQLNKTDEYNVHSQFGEDGILQRILDVLRVQNGLAVEFGAWDGVHLSNTALLRERGWRSVLIEADPKRVEELRSLQDGRTTIVHEFLEPVGSRSLDSILDRLGITEVDVASIDIDGDDLNILAHLSRRPTVICIEFNPGIAPPQIFINPEREHKGSSISAIHQVAQKRGYELVYATYCNAFLVRQTEADRFEPYDPYTAFYLNPRPSVMFLFDGEFRAQGDDATSIVRHPASTLPIYIPRLPRTLLGWPPTRLKVAAMYVYCAVAAPFFYLWQFWHECTKRVLRSLRGN